MVDNKLGLFDTPPSRQEVRVGLAVAGSTLVVTLATLPVYDVKVGHLPGFVPAAASLTLVCDLIAAAILYAQAGVFRSRALTVLASGYLFTGLLLIPYALTYPGAFSANGLLGARINTTAWIAAAWRFGIPTAILLYAWTKRADAAAGPIAERPPAGILLGVATAITLVALTTLLTTLGHDLLPPFFINQTHVIRSTLVIVNIAVIFLTIAAMAMLFRQRRSILDIWLLVALFSWLGQSVLNALLSSRLSFGAYAFFGLAFLSNLIVVLALITESNRLYARLALATAAREREREANRLSMDAVAAAISHEVGQPLAAVSLSTSSGLNWLTASRPNVPKAIETLHATNESVQRSFNVLKSIRAMLAKEPGWAEDVDINALVHEVLRVMEPELAGARVAVQLELSDGLPSVPGSGVQLRLVISNLVANAIQSLTAIRGRRRRIKISSTKDGNKVLLDVSDNGAGIASEDAWSVFEALKSDEADGGGIDLALCRTIVEEHGGRIHASRDEPHGATFHVRLRSASPEATH